MPIRTDGKWESWATRRAREAAEAVVEEEVIAEEAEAEAPKPQRRNKSAAEAAIANATGLDITIAEVDPE